MKEFFDVMEPTERFYWYVAIGASIIFVIQTIMTFIGADSDSGVDAEFEGNLDSVDHPFQLFSLRNLINFFLGFGWTGVSLYGVIGSNVLLGAIALVVGMIFIAIFFLVMKSLMRLAEDNSFNIDDTIDKTAEVYTTIPAGKSGKGKVSISVKGAMHELEAVTSNEEALRPGTLVKITGVNNNILIVSPMI
ncbi:MULTISPECIES: NfeD family protein [unclassified Dysgonomonas]|uniref:NfeD family protein n=1 Tax=unclassified Dysgonomonas TaxID=2630389 RepID=UPI0013EB5ABB|nr:MULTISPECIES: NfeD family protein [unclassified Dysgonomonas]